MPIPLTPYTTGYYFNGSNQVHSHYMFDTVLFTVPTILFSYYYGITLFHLKFALEDLTYAIFLEPMRSRLAFILSSRFNEWPDHIFPFFQKTL